METNLRKVNSNLKISHKVQNNSRMQRNHQKYGTNALTSAKSTLSSNYNSILKGQGDRLSGLPK